MHKISSYLYSNRISVVADLATFPVEWTPVYQRNIKIYKGVKNTVEFDIRNADQKRVNINNYNLKCLIMDVNNQEILTVDVDPVPNTVGLANMIVYAEDLELLTPQFLKYTLYILGENDHKTAFYSDTQFAVGGTIELLGGVVPEVASPQIIDAFIYMVDDTDPGNYVYTYTSDAVEVNPRNDLNTPHSIRLEFWPETFDADVTVQITNDVVVSMSTAWNDLETFTITNSTDRVSKTYNEISDYSNNVGWLRIKYVPNTGNTGKIDKVLVFS
jgi:hypothetical protein